jgi:hypothetical protein
MTSNENHKPIIETIINTIALALSAYGVTEITAKGDYLGLVCIVFAAGLEFFKYWGRKQKYW